MTVIAGAIDKDGTVYIGADKVGSDGDVVRALRTPKVRHNGPFLMGVCGSMRVVQIAHYLFKPPKPRGELFAFMVTKFAAALRAAMKKEGGETKDEDEQEVMNGGLLVGYRGRLFEIDSSYAVIEVDDSFHAIGCAEQEARSAMRARRRSGARQMVKAGLDAAAAYDANIRPPFTIDSI